MGGNDGVLRKATGRRTLEATMETSCGSEGSAGREMAFREVPAKTLKRNRVAQGPGVALQTVS